MTETGALRRVTLITVLYRSADVVADALAAAQTAIERAGLEAEVILVDNNPADGSAEAAIAEAPQARVLSNPKNVGFGRACNQAFAVATGQWWILLNPDAVLDEDAVVEMVGFAASHPRAGAVAPTLTGAGRDRAESGGMLPGIRSAIGHFLFLNRFLPRDEGGPWRGLQVQRRPALGSRRLEWASGGVLLLRPDAMAAVDGFDERYFLYGEDIDLGRRLGDANWDVWLLPDARAGHSIAASSGGVSDRWYRGLHQDYGRHANRVSVALFDLIASVGLALRAVAASNDDLHRRRMSVAARTALRLAGRTLVRGTDRA